MRMRVEYKDPPPDWCRYITIIYRCRVITVPLLLAPGLLYCRDGGRADGRAIAVCNLFNMI